MKIRVIASKMDEKDGYFDISNMIGKEYEVLIEEDDFYYVDAPEKSSMYYTIRKDECVVV